MSKNQHCPQEVGEINTFHSTYTYSEASYSIVRLTEGWASKVNTARSTTASWKEGLCRANSGDVCFPPSVLVLHLRPPWGTREAGGGSSVSDWASRIRSWVDGTQDDVASTRRLEPQAHHGGKGGSSGRRQTLCTHTHTHTHTQTVAPHMTLRAPISCMQSSGKMVVPTLSGSVWSLARR